MFNNSNWLEVIPGFTHLPKTGSKICSYASLCHSRMTHGRTRVSSSNPEMALTLWPWRENKKILTPPKYKKSISISMLINDQIRIPDHMTMTRERVGVTENKACQKWRWSPINHRNIISLSFVAVQESIIPWYNNCLAQEYFRVIQIEDDENKTESAKSHWHLSLKLFNVILLDGSLR